MNWLELISNNKIISSRTEYQAEEVIIMNSKVELIVSKNKESKYPHFSPVLWTLALVRLA